MVYWLGMQAKPPASFQMFYVVYVALLGEYSSNTFATLLMSFQDDAHLWDSQSSEYIICVSQILNM